MIYGYCKPPQKMICFLDLLIIFKKNTCENHVFSRRKNNIYKKLSVSMVFSGRTHTIPIPLWSLESPLTLGLPVCISMWWFQTFFIFTPKLGEMIQFDEYFSDGWLNHQPEFVTSWFILPGFSTKPTKQDKPKTPKN